MTDIIWNLDDFATVIKKTRKQALYLLKRGVVPGAQKMGRDYYIHYETFIKHFEETKVNSFDPNKTAAELIEELNGKKEKRI